MVQPPLLNASHRNMAMANMPASMEGKTENKVTRFNALKHGVLSHDRMLPWKNESEYDALLGALIAKHKPQESG